MGDLVYDSSDSPPPPAYDISQTEFDQKTTRAIEQSAAEPPRPSVDEDGYEIWDEALFEAMSAGVGSSSVDEHASPGGIAGAPQTTRSSASEKARAGAEASQSRRPSRDDGVPRASGSRGAGPPVHQTRPLRVTKRSCPPKDRPSWYAEAGLGGSPPDAPAGPQANDAPHSRHLSAPRGPRRQLTVHNNTGDVAPGSATPPPEFTPVGPPLDGPPYETVVLSYDGPELEPAEPEPGPPAFDSLPQGPPPGPSPPTEDDRPHPVVTQSLPEEPLESTSPPTRPPAIQSHSVPSPAAPQAQGQVRQPVARFQPSPKSYSAPRLSFDPRTAYSKRLPAVPQLEEPQQEVYDASAFYSHAVAAQFSTNVPTRMRQPVQSDR
ncbi:hypothetical protein BD413DRAFT_550175 [Trametes elegans]|nr:hypothetical protein BD413DRAFT_550175 [Trametes elegans]